MQKPPWEKSLAELTKYDWLTAVSHNRKHQRRTRDLRVAIALMHLADAGTGLAWPTQETLAEMTGLADARQVRAALASLRGTGAITVERLSDLYEDTQAAAALKRKKRGKAYRLKLFWAYETLEASRSPATKRPEPQRLSDKRRTDAVRSAPESHRTNTVLQKRTDTVRFEADYISPAYTLEDTRETKEGHEGNDLSRLVPTREGERATNAYARAKGKAA